MKLVVRIAQTTLSGEIMRNAWQEIFNKNYMEL
jgi:hypothetical protein